MILADRQIELYSRQIILRELGGTGQRRLLEGRCLLVGNGPAVETAATYLAGAGVGAIDLARVAPTTAAPPALLAYAPLSQRGPDAAVRDLGDGEIDAAHYDAILVVAPGAAAEPVHRRLPSRAAPRSGWVVVCAPGAGAVDLVALPAGASGCFACASVAPYDGPQAEGDPAPDPIAWSLAGALASLTMLRWIAAIAPETAPRAARLAAGAPAWVEARIERRSRCPRGCPLTA